ncbi:hypothetical protein D0T49_11825 [Paludibacter sp. 221]|nr:hypothetical protein [Paludibacter sp. 221]
MVVRDISGQALSIVFHRATQSVILVIRSLSVALQNTNLKVFMQSGQAASTVGSYNLRNYVQIVKL